MKNNEKLLSILGETEDKHIPDIPEKKKSNKFLGWSAGIGACAAVAAIATAVALTPKSGMDIDLSDGSSIDPPESEQHELSEITSSTTTAQAPSDTLTDVHIYPYFSYEPKTENLQVLSPAVSFGATGFESLEFDSATGINNYIDNLNNPWTEDMELSSLPVFKNKVYDGWTSGAGVFICLSEDDMTNMAENTALLLNKEIVSMQTQKDMFISRSETENGYPTQEEFESAEIKAYEISAECDDDTRISVSGDGSIKITFNTPVQLPDGYNFNDTNDSIKSTEHLAEQYSTLLQYDKPDFFLNSEYNCVYDKNSDNVRAILNYNLSLTRFCETDSALTIIYIDNHFCSSEYLGDYPIINYDNAKQLLKEGNYITSAPIEGEICDDMIAAGELVYRSGSGQNEYFMPYYRFYVLIDDNNSTSEYNYAALYVPAVSSEYLTDMSVWNGSFN